MADYEGRVVLRADISQATREVDNFARRTESRPVRVAINTSGVLQARQSLAQLQRNIGELNKTPLNILAPGRSAQADTIRQLAQAGKEFYDGIISGNRQLASTTAGLKQQAAAFRSLADNINFSDQAQRRFYRNFAQAIEMGQIKSMKARLQELVALQDLYQKGVSGLGQDISPRAGGLEQVLSLGKDLPRTKAALSEYRDELSRVYDLVETRSLSGGIISLEISNVEKELLKIENDRLEALDQINNVKKAGYSLTGKQLFLEEEHLANIERRRAAANELVRLQRQQATDTYSRDRALSRDFGVSPTRTLRPAGVSDEEVALRNLIATQSRLNAIEEENLAAVERRIGARQAEIAVANELVKLQRQQAVDTYNRDRALSRDFGVNPGRALRPAGVSDEEVALRNLIATQSRLNAIEEENLAAVERRVAARQAEIAVANRLASLQYQQTVDAYNRDRALSRDFGVNPAMTLLPAGMSSQEVARRNTISDRTRAAAEASVFNAFSRQADEIQNDLPVLKSIGRNREKIEAETAREAQAAARSANQASAAGRSAELRRTQGMSFEERLAQKRPDLTPGGKRAPGFFRGNLRQALGEGLIGGAFPALFGQGVAASAGGAVGGIAGGAIGGTFGFGLALVGTAVGQAVDTTAKNLSDLAAALKSPNDAIKALETNGYRVSDSLKFQVEQLQAVGRGYDAQALVLKEAEKRLGAGSARELNALSTEQKKLDESYAVLVGTIQRSVIPGVIGFTLVLQDLLGFLNAIGKSRDSSVDTSKRNYRWNPFTGKLTDIGPVEKTGYQKRVDQAIARASQAPPRSPQERFADETTRIQESRKIADQIQSAYREAFNLQRQAHDLQRDGATLNKEIADYTYRKEREIFDLRQQAAERQIENNRAAAQNRIEGGDLSARQTFAAAVGFEQQLLSNVREVVRARKEGEADIEQSRNRLELAMARLNRDAEDYKRTNAREIEDIERRKLAYVRSVEDYKMRVADYIRDRSRESADLIKQAMVLPETGPSPAGATSTSKTVSSITGKAPNTLMGVKGIIEYLTGDTSSPGYRADHGGSNYHEHIAFASRQIRDGVIAMLRANGVQIGSIEGGRHAPNSYHYSGQAIDIPAAQVSVGKEKDLSARVRQLIASFLGGTPQAKAAVTIQDIPKPVLKNVPIGPTPSAAPINAARIAAATAMGGNEKEAQRILEEGIKLKQKGIELGQIEAILQANQLPQLQQQGDALKQQIEARQKIVNLSDNAASIADIEAESRARLKQIEATRVSALAQVQKQYKGDAALIKQVNGQAEYATKIAKDEEEQRRVNLELSNKLQNSEQARLQILQLQEGVAISRVELAALERGELQAGAVELLKASTLYQRSDEAQKSTLVTLTAQTEELQKQKQFMEKLVSLQLDATYAGAGLRSGRIGAEARAFEQGLKENKGDIGKANALANATRATEDRQMVWSNLEKDIVNASDAISGGLTNGLLDIVSGAKQVEDVGRDMLSAIAGSFADSAQQQLSALLQRQFAGMIAGSLGTGAAAAGPQALSGASLTAAGSLGFLNNAALALGATLQTIAGQSTLYGQMGGASGFASLFSGAGSAAAGGASGSAGFSPTIPQLAPALKSVPNFAGFFANGGTLYQDEFAVVGEKEPEFFFPGVTGTVVPRSTVEKAAKLREANQTPGKIDLSYTVTEQRGERYVTEEQFRKSHARMLQQSQAMFVSSTRQNKNVRDSMGI